MPRVESSTVDFIQQVLWGTYYVSGPQVGSEGKRKHKAFPMPILSSQSMPLATRVQALARLWAGENQSSFPAAFASSLLWELDSVEEMKMFAEEAALWTS